MAKKDKPQQTKIKVTKHPRHGVVVELDGEEFDPDIVEIAINRIAVHLRKVFGSAW